MSLCMLACLATAIAACGGGDTPTAPSSLLPRRTATAGVWTTDTNASSLHAGRYVALDQSVLDVWRGHDGGPLSDLRLRKTNGDTIHLRIDAAGRPIYFEDPAGARFWINQYFEDGLADVTVQYLTETWRGTIDVSDVAGSVGAFSLASDTGTTLPFCDARTLQTLHRVSTGICAVSVVVTILSKGALAKTLVHCATESLLIELLKAQLCPHVVAASEAMATPERRTTMPLDEPRSPIPSPPAAPVTPIAPTSAEAFVVDTNGRLAAVTGQGRVRLIGDTGVVLTDIAFNASGQLFGISFTDLYVVDANSGRATPVGPHGVPGGNALTFGPTGVLYSAGSSSTSLFTISPSTGATSSIGNMGFSSGGDITFLGNSLYMTSGTNQLVRISPSNPSASSIVGLLNMPDVFGLSTSPDGSLYGAGGTSLFSVNSHTAGISNVASFAGQGLGQAFGLAFRAR